MAWKSVATLFAAAVFACTAWTQEPVGAVQPAGQPVIGLALEGGGALGLAHIGVLQWMEENHIPIDRLAGTSMGALVGALYASGLTPAELRALAVSDAFTNVFTLQTPYADASFRRRQDRHELPQAITAGLKHGVGLHNALLNDRGVNEFLETNMPAYNRQDLDFDRMPIPFRCVATDLNTLEPVTFASGPLPNAVRASISIPGVFPPVEGPGGHVFVDGGILDNLPTDVLRHDLRAGVVIAVHLQAAAVDRPDTSSILAILNRTFSAGIARNEAEAERLADVVVAIPVDKFSATDYSKGAQLVHAGYLAAEQYRAVLLRYALNAEDWNTYLAARARRSLPPPGQLRKVRVQGGSPRAEQQVHRDIKPAEGNTITPATTLGALKHVQSNGEYSATYETFGAVPPASSTNIGADTGILVHLNKDPIGPPYLLIGPELTAASSNISRGEVTLRFIDQNFGGFGSEIRANARLGYMTDLNAEYYRLLTPGGYFLEPRACIVREPVYIWVDQKRVAERLQQNLDAGLAFGYTFGNTLQVSAEWRAEDTRWSLTTGSGGGPYLNGTAQAGLLHFDLDRAASGAISPNGFRLSASAGALYHAIASSNAPLANFSFSRTVSFNENNIFGMSGEVHSYLRANVAEPFRFTLGGPLRLSASSFDEYRGTDTYLARTGYMRRIAALPTGLGHGLYGILGYEAGEIWSPEARAILRQDGTLGLVGNTPLGLITFGVSVGDAGHRKVFVTMGRWF